MDNSSGPFGENCAARYLETKGFRILERNYHSRFGEIDIIAQDGRYLVFAEVKTRKNNASVGPLEAVTPGKQKKIIKTALCYLQKNPCSIQPRFDVIGITLEDMGNGVKILRHIENAFEGKVFL